MKSGGTAAFWKGPRQMPITDLLERNHKLYGGETALVEINPEIQEKHRVTWKEYELIEPASTAGRSPGASSTRRPTGWPTCSSPAG